MYRKYLFLLTVLTSNLVVGMHENAQAQGLASITNTIAKVYKALQEKIIADPEISVKSATDCYYENWLSKIPSSVGRCEFENPVINMTNNAKGIRDFQDVMQKELVNLAQNNENLIIWAALGSNGLKREFNTLETFFSKHPTARVWLDCIDPNYSLAVNILEDFKQDGYLSKISPISFNIYENHKHSTDAETKSLYITALQLFCTIRAFLQEMAVLYPEASLYIRIHGTCEDYDKRRTVHPTIVSKIQNNSSDHAMQDYIQLVSSIYNTNCLVRNVALVAQATANGHYQASMMSINPSNN